MSQKRGKKGNDDLQAEFEALNSIRRSLQAVNAILPALERDIEIYTQTFNKTADVHSKIGNYLSNHKIEEN